MGHHSLSVWLGFTAVVGILLALDLLILNRRAHVLTLREALSWSGSLVACALLFGLFIYNREGGQSALEYYTGYLIELSLSVDNLFVFILVFQYFRVPSELQPMVLKWGIFGAIVMRLMMILAGSLLLARFEWIVYLFGGILVFTGVRMFRQDGASVELEHNRVAALARRFLPFADGYDGPRFFTRNVRGRSLATPLLLVLLVIEWTDLVFAIDSIPAIFAITRDPFLVYSSNIFAILGLRALFFVLAGIMDRFEYLKPGVALILVLVGVKMLLSYWLHIPTVLSLVAIVLILATAIILSLRKASRVGAAA